MGYHKMVTYILETENGASLRASGFTCEGRAGGKHWTGIRNTGVNTPPMYKIRYTKILRRKP